MKSQFDIYKNICRFYFTCSFLFTKSQQIQQFHQQVVHVHIMIRVVTMCNGGTDEGTRDRVSSFGAIFEWLVPCIDCISVYNSNIHPLTSRRHGTFSLTSETRPVPVFHCRRPNLCVESCMCHWGPIAKECLYVVLLFKCSTYVQRNHAALYKIYSNIFRQA